MDEVLVVEKVGLDSFDLGTSRIAIIERFSGPSFSIYYFLNERPRLCIPVNVIYQSQIQVLILSVIINGSNRHADFI